MTTIDPARISAALTAAETDMEYYRSVMTGLNLDDIFMSPFSKGMVYTDLDVLMKAAARAGEMQKAVEPGANGFCPHDDPPCHVCLNFEAMRINISGLTQFLETEKTMHQAWRKRAEEAEVRCIILESALDGAQKVIEDFAKAVEWNHKKGDILLDAIKDDNFWQRQHVQSAKYEVPWKAAADLLKCAANLAAVRKS
jgi:hypothetical protein